ncbi:MAG: Trk system potassium transporter TrkA [Thermoanaerobaculales bacterium]|nr:Trk system potassium transporter TrkA [Thermoanaerobaculales bacterium]
MKAIIVGGGLVGSSLAAKLAGDDHDVVLVEKDRELIRELNERLDVQTIVGNGTTVPVLKKAGIEACDLLLATTDSDEANMVVALVGSALFKVPRVVARLRDSGHEESFRSIAAEIGGERLAINPDNAAVERILSLMTVPGAVDVTLFFGGRLQVAGFLISKGSGFNGLLLSHLKLLFPAVPMLVVAIRRDGRWMVPHGEDELLANDLVYFAMDPAETDNVLGLLGLQRGPERRVMIAGATRIGVELARRLETKEVGVTLIDSRRSACESAAAELSSTLVIHGRPTDREDLVEEGIDRVDDFIACTDDHEENVVACLLARRLGATHNFALVDNPALAGLIGEVGIDAVISPRLLSVSLALQFARKGRVKAVAALLDDAVEVFEAEAGEGSRLVRNPLEKLGLPKGVLVAAVRREDQILVPTGSDRINAGDRVLLITTTENATRLDDFLDA